MQHSTPAPYCRSRAATIRRRTVEVNMGRLGLGGLNPIRIQSMTTSDTQDIDATVAQSVALADAGCEIVRVTAPNVQAAACLREIRSRFSDRGFAHVPLVADIHFLPQAAMEAVEHVEKIRINPGNYADKKKFAVRDYSDADYARELERLHEAVSPLILRCKTLGRCLRIGTNHGSLSDRIMNRYGDSPLGMVESALEFVRICEDHGFHNLVLSMKASNPKVVIQAYRLLVARMDKAHRPYPLHLGVTEAGDGEDGRIKSAIGIGSLLLDGLGDTIRVSLTEDSVEEIPVARALAEKVMSLWGRANEEDLGHPNERLDPFSYGRRTTVPLELSPSVKAGGQEAPRVLVPSLHCDPAEAASTLEQLQTPRFADTPPEGLLLRARTGRDIARLGEGPLRQAAVVEVHPDLPRDSLQALCEKLSQPALLCRRFAANEATLLADLCRLTRRHGHHLALDLSPGDCRALAPVLQALGDEGLIATLGDARRVPDAAHATGAYRALAAALGDIGSRMPLWIRVTAANAIHPLGHDPLSRLLEGSILAGSLLCDGLGDLLSVELEPQPEQSIKLAYNILQGCGARITKTEYVACPSCGRTLFDLQSTTQRIRSITNHLKGVKIAIMGCIVNGPGEMADADFGYVGGAPGKINLYVGKNCVQYNIPQAEADQRLVELIKSHGRWTEPGPTTA